MMRRMERGFGVAPNSHESISVRARVVGLQGEMKKGLTR